MRLLRSKLLITSVILGDGTPEDGIKTAVDVAKLPLYMLTGDIEKYLLSIVVQAHTEHTSTFIEPDDEYYSVYFEPQSLDDFVIAYHDSTALLDYETVFEVGFFYEDVSHSRSIPCLSKKISLRKLTGVTFLRLLIDAIDMHSKFTYS